MPNGLERLRSSTDRRPQLRSSSAHCDQELARRRGGEVAESYVKIQQPSPGRWGTTRLGTSSVFFVVCIWSLWRTCSETLVVPFLSVFHHPHNFVRQWQHGAMQRNTGSPFPFCFPPSPKFCETVATWCQPSKLHRSSEQNIIAQP